MDDIFFFVVAVVLQKNSSVANARMNIRGKKKERDLGYTEAFKTPKFIEKHHL